MSHFRDQKSQKRHQDTGHKTQEDTGHRVRFVLPLDRLEMYRSIISETGREERDKVRSSRIVPRVSPRRSVHKVASWTLFSLSIR